MISLFPKSWEWRTRSGEEKHPFLGIANGREKPELCSRKTTSPNMRFRILTLMMLMTVVATAEGQAVTVDAVTSATPQVPDTAEQKKKSSFLQRLRLGGYGEAVVARNFYSQSFNRYNAPARYKNDKSHGEFDLPHVTFNLGFDFGRGWTLGTEIEFEHGGNETAVEIEAEESGEYEAETEKGGEVAIEQFWLNKEFLRGKLNVRAGEIIVPVGYSNAYHEPLNFFTCYRPEGEATILPNTWHQLGLSLWGRVKDWRYEVQLLSALNSESFTAEKFVHQGATSPYEYKVANCYATALRLDNYSLKGLRVGLSGYYGHTFRNSLKTPGASYDDVKGALGIISGDFALKRWNWIVRGGVVYAHLSDADRISAYNKANSTHHKYQDGNPFHNTNIASAALAVSVEAGYDIFSQIHRLRRAGQRLYLFGRFDHYDSMYKGTYRQQYRYCAPFVTTVGFNYHPIPQIVVKGEYAYRAFRQPNNHGLHSDSPLYVAPYNNEPSLRLSIAFQGWFL